MIYFDFPSSLGFGVEGQSYSNVWLLLEYNLSHNTGIRVIAIEGQFLSTCLLGQRTAWARMGYHHNLLRSPFHTIHNRLQKVGTGVG